MEKAAAQAIILALLIIPAIAAAASTEEKEYGLKLLAVSETGDGVTANLYLRIAPGTGNVFIEAEPVTKLDTRISLKLAKEIACESLPAISSRCDGNDFFFRIEANASLVGGPSAGAAAAALAIAAVDDASISQSVAVTGTINSGGLIGQVGGLKEKIDAAAQSRMSTVLIPSGERYYKNESKTTAALLDLADYGKSLGVEVREVSDIKEALLQLTGKNYSDEEKALEIDKHYSEVMENLADEICGRSTELSEKASEIDTAALKDRPGNQTTENLKRVLETAKNSTSGGLKEREKGSYYSAASMCFGANVRHSYLLMLGKNLSREEALEQINATAMETQQFESEIPEAKTIAGMQTRGTVMDRLDDARQLLELSAKDMKGGNYNDAIYRLAFAKERLGSARAWNRFLTSYQGSGTAPFVTAYKNRNESLRNGCITRLQEADEHIQYLDIYLPGLLKSSEELGPVYSHLRQGGYASCIYKASLAKAKANAMLSALSGNENLTKLIDQKLKAAKESIVRQTNEGDFPIISYSYYEYSGSLKDTDQPSALLYSEYALELSSLKAYLNHNGKAESPQAGETAESFTTKTTTFLIAAAAASGFAAGVIVAVAASAFGRKPRKKLLVKAKTSKK
ncbi:hypothetical protein HYU20_02900 [Candidatus Woesearchaeota archaeon]|nr:hypothetical protein [Candidatus Woesearchaeota archaeon]